MKKAHHNLRIPILLIAMLSLSGCDAIYGVLQREGAQERQLLGNIPVGTYNPVVEEIQKLLELYGYGPGKVDGKLGPNTRITIEKFQKDHNIKVTRFIDKKTWAKLTQFASCGLVVSGEIDTKAVQVALYNAGFDPGKIDGKLGRRTVQTVRDFQRVHELKVDGKIGYQTLSQLKHYLPKE